MKKNISVIVPVYNVENYIQKCVQSILHQSFKDFELIIVNDGTPDGSIEKIKELIEEDSRIILINKENEGLSSARNAGLNVATGKYVSFVDSDDYIDVDFLKNLFLEAEHSESELLLAGYHRVFENGNCVPRPRNIELISENLTFGNIALKKHVMLSEVCMVQLNLYSREFLIKNNLSFTVGIYFEDIDFLFRCFILAKKVRYSKKIDYYYLENSQGILGKKNKKKVTDLNYLLNKFLESYSHKELDKELLSYCLYYISNAYFTQCYENLNKGSEIDKKTLSLVDKVIFNSEILPKKNKIKYIVKWSILKNAFPLFKLFKRFVNSKKL